MSKEVLANVDGPDLSCPPRMAITTNIREQRSSRRLRTLAVRGIVLPGAIAAAVLAYRVLERTASRDSSAQVDLSQSRPARFHRNGPREGSLKGAPRAGSEVPFAPASVERVPAAEQSPPAEPRPEDYVDSARAEQRDDSWAAPTERLFEEDLTIKGQQLGFRVGTVECRTTSCIAELFWNSLREARADFKQTLGAPDRSK